MIIYNEQERILKVDYPGIHLEQMRKATRISTHGNRCTSWISNWLPWE